jgi:hypothetical protein
MHQQGWKKKTLYVEALNGWPPIHPEQASRHQNHFYGTEILVVSQSQIVLTLFP